MIKLDATKYWCSQLTGLKWLIQTLKYHWKIAQPGVLQANTVNDPGSKKMKLVLETSIEIGLWTMCWLQGFQEYCE